MLKDFLHSGLQNRQRMSLQDDETTPDMVDSG